MHNFFVDYQENKQDRHECHQILGSTEETALAYLLQNMLARGITPTLVTSVRGAFTMDELERIAICTPEEAMQYDTTFYMEGVSYEQQKER